MDQLVHDFNTALDETAGSNSSSRSSASRRKSWKRRCKSTSNLNTGNNISDDSSSSVDNIGLLSRDRGTSSLQFSDSDLEAPGSMGTMARQGRSRTKRGRGDIIMGIESDSFTENVQPWQDFRGHTRRRRKFKRMAIGTSLEVGSVRGVTAVKRKKVRSKSGYEGAKLDPKYAGGITPGKRKRSAREKSVESGDMRGHGDRHSRLRTVSLGDNNDKMELEDASSSSSLSSSEWEDVDNCPEGEADDEQSDWPGHDTGLTDDELDTEVSFNTRKLLSGGRDRMVRAGSRRLKTGERHQAPYGEMMHRFIKDNSLQSLRMTSVKSSDRNMIFSLARMYNLSVATDLSTVTVTKASGGSHRSRTGEAATEFAVPGVPQLRPGPGGYRDPGARGSNKKQRKYGPPPIPETQGAGPSSSGVVTRHQQASGSRHRSHTSASPSTIGSQST